ncbi:MAG: FecR protein, partial [Deltaproteobacteria bacterium]|nr:FecR protein [Deltaproteobacteria bacterium]
MPPRYVHRATLVAALMAFASGLGAAPLAANDLPAVEATEDVGRTPPLLSFLDGNVSFWRPGADDWAPAQINTPLAPGDQLYSGVGANLELQVGARAFVRAGTETQLGIENQERGFLQLKLTAGHVSIDLRSVSSGQLIELDTPNAAFTIDRTGYYRVDVDDRTTTFISRRGGRATMIPAGGNAAAIAPSEEVVIEGADAPRIGTYAAPEVDDWDRWNYDRTDSLIESLSTRYLSPSVYGADALDHYGTWRVIDEYGPVWIPTGVAPEWSPYSTGRWIWDPYYGWTWVDTAPWGWAPYHYGRWVYTTGFWAWAPGPVVVTPVYAPALVAFFSGNHWGVSIGVGVPAISWVPLGWGEPCIPWWGHHGFVGRPWWGGWGGPRVVNNIVISKTTVVDVTHITYTNTRVRDGVVAARQERFGHGRPDHVRLRDADVRNLEPVRGPLPVRPVADSLVPTAGRATQPPEEVLKRRVVATRAPHDPRADLRQQGLSVQPRVTAPAPHVVDAPRRPNAAVVSPRPPFGQEGATERVPPSMPRRFGERVQPGAQPEPRIEPQVPAPAKREPPAPRIPERRVPSEVRRA